LGCARGGALVVVRVQSRGGLRKVG
jgi:hypothetical protein